MGLSRRDDDDRYATNRSGHHRLPTAFAHDTSTSVPPCVPALVTAMSEATKQPTFVRIHQTLRVTPAMEAGIADHAWTVEEIVALVKEEDVVILR
jgi:hypothetical protein